MKTLAAVTLAATLSIWSLSLHAGSAPSGVDPTPELKRQLRGLVTAQEGYWADHGTYTTDVSALGLFAPHRTPSTAADSVWLQVIQEGGRSGGDVQSIAVRAGRAALSMSVQPPTSPRRQRPMGLR